MKIAYISADFGVPIWGCKGASVHVREMVASWCKAGHWVGVISPAIETAEGQNGRKVEREIWQEAVFLPITLPQRYRQLFKEYEALDKFLGSETRLRQEQRNLLYNLTLYERALDYLRSQQVDCIYERYALFGYAGLRLARALGVPHLLEVNALLAYEQEKMRGLEMKRLAREIEDRLFHETDRMIVVSRRLQEFAASCGVPESRIHILPNAVDPQRFIPADGDHGTAIRARYQLGGKCVIGFVGSLKPWHGTETLFAAFERLRQMDNSMHLLIVGDGPEREALEKYAQNQGLNGTVTFTGNVPYDEVPQYLAAMDIAVAPYVPNENFYFSPIKIFEYMAMGKPVVAGSIGQVQELVIDGKTGLLYEPGSVAGLVAALTKLVRDAPLCRRLGEKARAWVEKERTWENNARQVVKIADELIIKRKR
jgi:glycosyltransferase involved in cell wall biosynthesis